MYPFQMLRYFRGSKLARMSDGSYCIIRDLGLVKGGKGMRHHEVLVTLSPGADPAPRDQRQRLRIFNRQASAVCALGLAAVFEVARDGLAGS